MKPVTIIIPVYGQYDLVKRCVESVLRNTDPMHRIVVVDDNSPDQKTKDYVNSLVSDRVWAFVSIDNLGFGKRVNRAVKWLSLPGEDVIILNSDTEVPPNWVERLQEAKGSRPDVAAVCPLSNSATIYSVPNPGHQELPKGYSIDQFDNLVESLSLHEHPEIPTVMGFCMLIDRKAWDKLGGFDPAYGRGYGEEVDWCLRARAAGYKCVLADDLFVYHVGHASFGDNLERDELCRKARELVDERYPDYMTDVKNWWLACNLRGHRIRIADALRPRVLGKPSGKKIVHIMHNYGTAGGVETVVRRQILADPDNEHTVIFPREGCTTTDGVAFVDGDGTLVVMMNPEMCQPVMKVAGFSWIGEEARQLQFLNAVASALAPDEIIVEHSAGWCSHLSYTGVTRVLHDEYLICPVFRRFGDCEKPACDKSDECLACVKQRAEFLKPVEDRWIREVLSLWQLRSREVLAKAGVVSSPSYALARKVNSALEPQDVLFDVSHHAPPVIRSRAKRKANPSGAVRVAFVGHASKAKGFEAFADAVKGLNTPNYEISVIGPVDPDIDRAGLDHVKFIGGYHADDLGTLLQFVDIAIPAVTRNEAYGLVVDECIAAGCEVLVPDVPAIKERMFPNYSWGEGGQLFDAIVGSEPS